MSISNLFWVFLGGGLGSVLRYGIGYWVPESGGFPWATFWANMLSCLIIGFLLTVAPILNESTRLLLIAGFCGGLSTFSTFSRETFQLLQRGEWLIAGAYVMASVMVGLVVVFGAWQVFHRD